MTGILGTVDPVDTADPVDPVHLVDVADRDGLAAALRAVLDRSAPVPGTRSGLTLLPAGWATGPGVTPLPHRLAESEGLALVRVDPASVGGDGYPVALAAVRLGLLQGMLAAAVAHLAARESDGAPLTARQLVQGAVADVATTVQVCRQGLRPATDPASVGWMHARLDAADLTVSALFGARGYLLDHPVRCLHLAELVRAAWTPERPGDGEW